MPRNALRVRRPRISLAYGATVRHVVGVTALPFA